MVNGFQNAFEYKVIYIFTIDDDTHKDLIKIGDATLHTSTQLDKLTPNCRELNQAALKRIKSYTNTAGLTPHLLHTEVAIRTVRDKEGTLKLQAFRDHDVHYVLKNSEIKNVELGETTGREWFRVDLDTAKAAIEAVKNCYSNLSNSNAIKYVDIVFRPEQKEAIERTVKQFKKADRMLWNAKMRFGKTLCALEVIKRCKFKKTIIMTHRPVVDDGWYDDFTKIFHGEQDYIYGSKAKGYTAEQLIESGKNFVYFASVQDLRGSSEVGGKHKKNDIIFKTQWDCVIVDEAHEGTTTALGEDTVKAVFKEGKGTKFLALSGTPFNILTDFDENSIYTWDYIMEQECKSEWDKLHFGDSNPYDELPELKIYTYSLGDILANKNYITFEDKAFNFHEFFRVWTGDFGQDHASMPADAKEGDFVHKQDIKSFLNLLTKEDLNSYYPYSNEEYRGLFKHSLWIVPGVKEARALKKLMLEHNIFGNGMFEIVNVAGSGDEEEKSEEALTKVRKAIKDAGKDNYTITLSCGKLTTGVTVKEWTAVFMLAGSYSTSAANYLQTIFRVQSPCNDNGKIKETAYVFDFAPDRTLKMVASAVSVSAKAGKTKESDKKIMGKFLNYCPVISVTGSEMQEYNANKLLQQLKRAYADKVVRNGFDDTNLYNDELLKLQEVDIQKFNDLKGIIGTSKAAPKQNDITVNDQGLTNEEYEEVEKIKKKPKSQLSEADKAKLEEIKNKKKLRNDAISILRGISIRMPLLIYGADIPYDEEITLDKFVEMVDDSSWEEFMPKGVTKEKFREFKKYYDEEVFIAAGRRIRNIAKEADTLEPTERVKKIASLFSYFKNPDKETVLTPWRVVNMHMSDCLGGWDFWNEDHSELLETPRFVDRGRVTAETFGKEDARILEINSKTGLYPLYVTYSVYREKYEHSIKGMSEKEKQELWFSIVNENIYIICKTPMAKAITKRTLVGYFNEKMNAHYFDDLINIMKNKPQLFIEKINKGTYWRKQGTMKFDAIVGNPPYQQNIGIIKENYAVPIYQDFVSQAKRINPKYLSMIMPARWYAGGRGLDAFREEMLNDNRLRVIQDFPEATDCFPGVQIKAGVCYFLWDREEKGKCAITTHLNDKIIGPIERPLLEEGSSTFIRYNQAISILHKVYKPTEKSFADLVSPQTPFGMVTSYKGNPKKIKETDVKMYISGNDKQFKGGIAYAPIEMITKGHDLISEHKIYIGAAGSGSDSFPHLILSKPFYGEPNTVCNQTYLVIGPFKSKEICENVISYIHTKLFRFMVLQKKNAQHAMRGVYQFVPMQDFSKAWTDEELYKKYSLTDEEIQFIDSMIKPME